MINPNNEPAIQDILRLVDQWESYEAYYGLSYDLWQALAVRIKPESEHVCPECKRPADGVSRDCGMCAQRKPLMYSVVYGGLR